MDRFFAYLDRLKPGDQFVFILALCMLVASSFFGVVQMSNAFLVDAPRVESVITEGFVGVPRFVNPVLATTQLDKDLVALTFAGIMRVDASGELVYDLAEDVAINEEGTIYTIKLAQDKTWSDGTPVTAEDVAFTIRTIQDAVVGSPLRPQFQNVSVEVVGTNEVVLTIPTRDPKFIELLTLGILPTHIWSTVLPDRFSYSEYNMQPVGAGMFTLASSKLSADGSPEKFVFEPRGVGTRRPQSTLLAVFFTNEESRMLALRAGTIDIAAGIDTGEALQLRGERNITLVTRTLPRTFGLFFNQKVAPALLDTAAREAFDILIDRTAIAKTVLDEYGEGTKEPLSISWRYGIDEPTTSVTESGPLAAKARLEKGGWMWVESDGHWTKKLAGATTTLSFTITTLNAPVFIATAAALEAEFAKIGVSVKTIARERADINTVVAAREYEMLLYGTAFGRSRDLYPFWHSSRRADPGLNVALYTNLTADTALDKLRSSTNNEDYATAYTSFMTAFRADTPALFLFSPHFIYAVREDVALTIPARMVEQSERFANVAQWYKGTERVWRIFSQ